jgi:hypothetical protein
MSRIREMRDMKQEALAQAIEFGKANQELVVDKFISDLFLMTNN